MNSQEFKYSEIMDTLELPCPPENFEKKETVAFRWVFDTIENELNFLPQYFKNPQRFQNKPSALKCQSVGLSFFDSEESARKRFNILTGRMLTSVKFKIGKKLAEGKISEKDGESNQPDEKGHFTLHQFKDVDLKEAFTIIGDL